MFGKRVITNIKYKISKNNLQINLKFNGTIFEYAHMIDELQREVDEDYSEILKKEMLRNATQQPINR